MFNSMFNSLKRVIRSGWLAFSRNLGLSIATIFVMVMAIFLITFLFIFNTASKVLISNIREKVDISVYFKKEAPSEEILDIKSELIKIPEVKDVEFITKEEVLERFVERHKNDPALLESLNEIGENPFFASLNIRAWQASQYEQINNFLENHSKKEIIEKVDYYERKPIIDKIFSVTSNIKTTGIIFSLILGLIAVLVALNTIRIAICSLSEEISTMRLVGASNWFIRGPFLIQGIVAGFFALLAAFLISFSLCYLLDSKIRVIAPSLSFFNLFLKNFWILLLIQFATGIGLGIISSAIAIRRYLKI